MFALKLPYSRHINNLPKRLSLDDTALNTISIWKWLWQQYDFRCARQILEVGAGMGDFWINNQHKIGKDKQITCIDISKSNLDRFASRLGFNRQFRLRVMNTNYILFGARQFDAILAHNVLHLLDKPLQAVTNIHHVLNTNGLFAVLTPAVDNCRLLFELADEVIAKPVFTELYQVKDVRPYIEKEFKINTTNIYQNKYMLNQANIAVDYVYFASLQKNIALPTNFYQDYQDKIRKLIENEGALIVNADLHLYLCEPK